MAATVSFDITSTIDFQEVDNALNQARKEVAQRYDFKGSKASIEACAARPYAARIREMKFLMAILAYVLIGLVLGAGMLMTVKGKPWLLIVGFIAYVVAFGKIGCLPKKTH